MKKKPNKKKASTKKQVKKAVVKKVVEKKDHHCCIDGLKQQVALLTKRCDELEETCKDLKRQIQDTFVGEIREPVRSIDTVPVSIPSSPFMQEIHASPAKFDQSVLPKSWGSVRS